MRHRLVLDVDGVVLDADRGGDGHWTNELERRHGIDRASLREAFFAPHWHDIVIGAQPIEPLLASALRKLGSAIDVETVLGCWFEADFVPVDATIGLARSAVSAGIPVALATNQERRRAAFLRERLDRLFQIDDVVASCDIGAGKPDPSFFAAADERFGADASSTIVFVDDTGVNVTAARKHGWVAVHARPETDWISVVAEHLGIERPG